MHIETGIEEEHTTNSQTPNLALLLRLNQSLPGTLSRVPPSIRRMNKHEINISKSRFLQRALNLRFCILITQIFRRDLTGEKDIFTWDFGLADCSTTGGLVAVCCCGIDLADVSFEIDMMWVCGGYTWRYPTLKAWVTTFSHSAAGLR